MSRPERKPQPTRDDIRNMMIAGGMTEAEATEFMRFVRLAEMSKKAGVSEAAVSVTKPGTITLDADALVRLSRLGQISAQEAAIVVSFGIDGLAILREVIRRARDRRIDVERHHALVARVITAKLKAGNSADAADVILDEIERQIAAGEKP